MRQKRMTRQIVQHLGKKEARVYLKTPNAPGQRAFSRCAAPFFLEIRQYSCEKMFCSAQKFLAAGHIFSFQIHPSEEDCWFGENPVKQQVLRLLSILRPVSAHMPLCFAT